MLEREFKGIWIPRDIWLNKNLSIVEKALLAEIDSLKVCNAGNEYFADFFGVSVPTITRAIAHLKDLGIIETSFNGRLRTICLIKMISLPNQNDEHINTSISNNTINKQYNLITDNTNKEDTYKDKVQNFVDTFNSICKSLPKCQRLSPKRSKAIVNILKKYSDREIVEVFKKLEASDFCTNRSGKGWRADIDFILREDKFISVSEGKYDNPQKRCNVERISAGTKKHISEEEKDELRKAVERGDIKKY